MTIKQLTSPVDVVAEWPNFVLGLRVVSKKSNEQLDETVMLKTVLWLVSDYKVGYVNVAYAGTKFVGFSIWQDGTPPFVAERSFIARAIFADNGNQHAATNMLSAFTEWARGQRIKRCIVSTRRHSGASIRHFESVKYGFSKGAITFEKLIQ